MPPGDPGDDEIDDLDDDRGFRPPLPPADRVWRHPSEVAAEARAVVDPVHPWWRDRRMAAIAVVSGMLGAVAAASVLVAIGGVGTRTEVVAERVAMPPQTVSGSASDDPVRSIADSVAPSIVAVRAVHGDTTTAGSATVLRSDGYLLTSAHLVTGADLVEVKTHDGASHAAAVVGIDPATDVAVLHVEADDLRPAAFATRPVDPGDAALVMGAPADGGWDTAVATGIVSATGQRLELDGGVVMHGMLVFDAPLSPGLSGGPLLDSSGAVIGVIAGAPAAGDRLGAAVPVDVARMVAHQILEHGHARHGWLGIEGGDLASEEAVEMGVAGGARVAGVAAGGPAADAGVEPGDVIVGVDDVEVDSMTDLIAELRRRSPGDTVRLVLWRDGSETSVDVVLGERTKA